VRPRQRDVAAAKPRSREAERAPRAWLEQAAVLAEVQRQQEALREERVHGGKVRRARHVARRRQQQRSRRGRHQQRHVEQREQQRRVARVRQQRCQARRDEGGRREERLVPRSAQVQVRKRRARQRAQRAGRRRPRHARGARPRVIRPAPPARLDTRRVLPRRMARAASL